MPLRTNYEDSVRMPGMAVPRVVMVTIGSHLAHRHHAPVGHRTSLTLKLNRRGVDVKALRGQRIDSDKDVIALRRRNIVDLHMAGHRVALRAKAPDMQIMHVDHA